MESKLTLNEAASVLNVDEAFVRSWRRGGSDTSRLFTVWEVSDLNRRLWETMRDKSRKVIVLGTLATAVMQGALTGMAIANHLGEGSHGEFAFIGVMIGAPIGFLAGVFLALGFWESAMDRVKERGPGGEKLVG